MSLWKKLGLSNHKYLKTTKLIIFILKIITLINSKEHENIIESLIIYKFIRRKKFVFKIYDLLSKRMVRH